ncbi:RNA polymerase sigma factor [Brevundimonas sp.]|jgi:RNA polymerase sigma-70 factor (ECF subfamily)|uniref:RNA polymerase sigma factor n=1 Tax=Brevundimonas sp. TaxID=1871086 RepID=UPI0037BE876A
MQPPSLDRNRWLAAEVLPHEEALRAWLKGFGGAASAEVDDLIQETYAVLAMRSTVTDIVDGRAYAFQVARSLLLRSVRRAKIVSIHAVADIGELETPDMAPSPFQHVAGREDLRQVMEVIAAMPPQTRRAFELRRLHGLSQRDIARRIGVSENTVEKHIGRGIRLLMEKFGRGGKHPRAASTHQETDRTVSTSTEEGSLNNAATRDSRRYS